MTSLFDIGLSGLRAAKYGMYLTSNNIANATNPFFSRREIDFIEESTGLFGHGVKVGDIRRIVNTLAEKDVLKTTQDWSKLSLFYEHLKNLETYVDNQDTSVVKFINDSLAALETLNTTSGSMQARNHYINQLKNMANRIKEVGDRLSKEADQCRKSVTTDVIQANEILSKLAQLNEKMGGQAPAEKMALFDQRDQLLNQLSTLINFDSQINDDGIVRLQFSNGLPLLVDTQATTLKVIENGENNKLDLAIESNGGLTSIRQLVNGGEIGGLLDYASNKLGQFQRTLDRVALVMSYKINERNQLGIDAQGNLGGKVFNDPNALGATLDRISPQSTNQGNVNASILIDDPSKITASNYELRFDASNHYNLVRLSDGQVVNTGVISGVPAKISADGFSVNIDSGTFLPGDVYSISPTKNAAAQFNLIMDDGSKLALGLPVSTSESSGNKGNGKISLNAVLDTTNIAFSIQKQLNPPIRVEFLSATTYRLVSANDNSIIEDNLTYDPLNGAELFPTAGGYDPGYRIQLSGTMQSGDTFSIDYNANGLGDNRNGLLLAELYRTGSIDDKRFTFSQGIQAFLFDISSTTSNVKISLDSNEILKKQAQARRDESSAVSLEEETMNLARYQESYLASAQVLEVVKQTMDVVFALLRR